MNRIGFAKVGAIGIIGISIVIGSLSGLSAQQRPPEQRFIVTVAPGELPERVARDHGVTPAYVYHFALNGFAGSISELARAGLMGDARIHAIEPDQIAFGTDTEVNPPWGLDRIDQRALPMDSIYTYSSDGSGVTAYIIDSGIRYTHTEFGDRASFGYDALGGDGSDCHGHGTHTAGIVGGATYGVAKNVRLVSVRVLACDLSGNVSDIIAGVDWVTAHHVSPAVANMSLGAGTPTVPAISTALDTAVQNMMFSGVVTAIVAGNGNTDACNGSPARVTNAMTIGASDSTDVRAAFSSYGNCVDWFAPGVGILSASNTDDSASKITSGSSNAAPHTAGIAALYLQSHPGASQIQARDALLSFTTKGVIANSNTPNNHLLFNAEIHDGSGDYISPATAITSPSNAAQLTRNTTVAIQASASDNDGLGWVTRVEFYVNGALTCTDTAAPYSCSWKVPASPKGATYVLQSKAFDAAGNAQTSPFVTVVAK